MRKFLILSLSMGFLWFGIQPLFSQQEKKSSQKEINLKLVKKSSFSYHPAGRRDPFRDLLAKRETKETPSSGGVSQISIDETNLIGIVKARGKFTAIISSPQGFPYKLKVGDKLLDGFVLSIKKSKVIFRKIKDRGIRLYRPRDIVKEINPEEQ